MVVLPARARITAVVAQVNFTKKTAIAMPVTLNVAVAMKQAV
jgi:hypothetical protein